jgi:hypothetical protein
MGLSCSDKRKYKEKQGIQSPVFFCFLAKTLGDKTRGLYQPVLIVLIAKMFK